MKNKTKCSARSHERAAKVFELSSEKLGRSLIIFVLFLLMSAPACASDNNYILFAHGMGGDKSDWDTFADHAENAGYTVFRTNVPPCGSVHDRARTLAKYINTLDAPDHSITAVGHSMGGVDLRYIVGEAHAGHEPFFSAAKKFKSVYTIASPHGGSFALELGTTQACILRVGGDCHIHVPLDMRKIIGEVAACSPSDPAWKDLSDDGMKQFNEKYPYSEFSVDGRHVPFLAFHFQCPVCGGTSDCAVGTNGQTWKGAPQNPGPSILAVHSTDIHNNICNFWSSLDCGRWCSPQCSSCECRTVDVGFVHQTVCPPLKDKCDAICNQCKNTCSKCPSCPAELSMTEHVLDKILTGPTDEAFSSHPHPLLSMYEAENTGLKQEGEQALKEQGCLNSGGNVSEKMCCKSSGDFPNTCLIGACGCAPKDSHEIKICDCGAGKCFNGTECVPDRVSQTQTIKEAASIQDQVEDLNSKNQQLEQQISDLNTKISDLESAKTTHTIIALIIGLVIGGLVVFFMRRK